MSNLVASPSVPQEPISLQAAIPTQNGPLGLEQKEESPFTLYQRDNGQPYTAKYFDIQDFKTLETAAPEGIASRIQAIDDYVKGQIEKGSFDSTKTYEQIIGNIKEILGIKDFEPPYEQIEKIYSFVNVNQIQQAPKVQQQKLIPNKQIKFNDRSDNQTEKQIQKYVKTLEGKFQKVDQALYKRVDNQLSKTTQKISENLSQLKNFHLDKQTEMLKKFDEALSLQVENRIRYANEEINRMDDELVKQMTEKSKQLARFNKVNALIKKMWN